MSYNLLQIAGKIGAEEVAKPYQMVLTRNKAFSIQDPKAYYWFSDFDLRYNNDLIDFDLIYFEVIIKDQVNKLTLSAEIVEGMTKEELMYYLYLMVGPL